MIYDYDAPRRPLWGGEFDGKAVLVHSVEEEDYAYMWLKRRALALPHGWWISSCRRFVVQVACDGGKVEERAA